MYNEVLTSPHPEEFEEVMRQEISKLEKHGTWTVVAKKDLPAGVNVLPSTWAFKVKCYLDGRLQKFKAHFCARGDKQVEGIYYFEHYSPVATLPTVQLILSLAAS